MKTLTKHSGAGRQTAAAAEWALIRDLRRQDELRWFEGAPSPELAALAAGVELKGSRGSARALAGETVSLAGLGAVGGEAFITLSRAGVGELNGFDFDRYEAESWLTQPADAADAGRLKAEVQGARAHAAGGGRVRTAVAFAQDIPWWVLRKSKALLVAGDNLELLVWAGNMACGLGIALLQGAVHGETWSAFVRAYDFGNDGGPCPACAFSRADWLRLKSRHGCDPGTMRAQGMESTRTLPNVCRTAADLLSSEALKWLMEMEGRLANEELSYCLLSHRAMRTGLVRNPDCRCPHERWDIVDVDTELAETSFATLMPELGEERGLDQWQVRGELPWVSFTLCSRCGERTSIRRFGREGTGLGECRCGESLRATPVGVRSFIPRDDLAAVVDVPLQELRLPQGAAIGMEAKTGAGNPTWFFIGPPPELRAEGFDRSQRSEVRDQKMIAEQTI